MKGSRKWEYTMVDADFGKENLIGELNTHGKIGWEAYAVTDNYVWLKRQID
jgi:hypothetical protein